MNPSITPMNRKRVFGFSPVALIRRRAVLLALMVIIGSTLYIASLASSTSSGVMKASESSAARAISKNRIGSRFGSLALPRFGSAWNLLPPQGPATVATFASDCTTAQTVFHPGDTICAQVAGALAGWRVIWSNSKFIAVQSNNLTSANQNVTFTLSNTASLGDWRVIIFDPFGGDVHSVISFTVEDPQNPSVDVQVSDSQVSPATSAGSQAVFGIQVTNSGPDDATNTQLTDATPTGTTFVSFTQLTGPVFSCTNPNAGDTGSSVCSIATLSKGATATFLATYLVDGSVQSGSTIDDTASVSNTVSDSNNSNDSSTASIEVRSTPCVLTCPSNITQDADSGQAGAVVSYSTPTYTGDCGTAATGEGGETIPVVSCSPASGSFFGVGTTTVICSAQAGTVCTFQVTVNNPGGLSISLNGANPLAVECGTAFTDPGATAVDATGQSVPVTISNPSGFNPGAPAVGSYTVTYTATEGQNSTSTTRTVNVSDTQAPKITIAGSNPFKIEQGTCLPFVDPGVSADDECAGPESVSSSISGPNGLTHVDTNTPGTYTITYTATDGTHSATATRTVLVGDFPPDEQDLGTANGAPVISLLGGDPETHALTIECGSTFTDPGATATNSCGNPLTYQVTGTLDTHTPGTYTLTYTVTDGAQTASVQRTITVVDTTAPTITVNGANPLTVECHSTFTDPGATAHDACAGDFAATASGTVNANVVGTYTLTYNATDPSGHAATPVTRTVNVVDTTAPVVTPPANVSVNTGAGATSCSVVVTDAMLGTASANDACQGPISSITRTGVPAGNVFPVGITTITYSATDAHNNTGTATQTVTVIDNTPPVISCPASITLEPTCPSGAIATYTAPVGTDNCAVTTARTAGLASGSVFPIGVNTVTYTATDASGNATSCSFTVTVKTAAQTVQDMITAVQAVTPPLSGTQSQGLVAKLQAALDAINQGKTNVACNKLADFISQVQGYIGSGTLTAAQGNPLISSANHVRNTIGCTNNPCT